MGATPRCLHCGRKISLLRKFSDAEFCCAEHRRAYQDSQSQLALDRLLEAQHRVELADARAAVPPDAAFKCATAAPPLLEPYGTGFLQQPVEAIPGSRPAFAPDGRYSPLPPGPSCPHLKLQIGTHPFHAPATAPSRPVVASAVEGLRGIRPVCGSPVVCFPATRNSGSSLRVQHSCAPKPATLKRLIAPPIAAGVASRWAARWQSRSAGANRPGVGLHPCRRGIALREAKLIHRSALLATSERLRIRPAKPCSPSQPLLPVHPMRLLARRLPIRPAIRLRPAPVCGASRSNGFVWAESSPAAGRHVPPHPAPPRHVAPALRGFAPPTSMPAAALEPETRFVSSRLVVQTVSSLPRGDDLLRQCQPGCRQAVPVPPETPVHAPPSNGFVLSEPVFRSRVGLPAHASPASRCQLSLCGPERVGSHATAQAAGQIRFVLSFLPPADGGKSVQSRPGFNAGLALRPVQSIGSRGLIRNRPDRPLPVGSVRKLDRNAPRREFRDGAPGRWESVVKRRAWLPASGLRAERPAGEAPGGLSPVPRAAGRKRGWRGPAWPVGRRTGGMAAAAAIVVTAVIYSSNHPPPKKGGVALDGRVALAQPAATLLAGLHRRLMDRAAVRLFDDFRSGLGAWQGEEGWAKSWKYGASGFLEPGQLALFSPTLGMSDYTFSFLAQIDRRSLNWVFRARDEGNHYVMRIVITKPGPLPSASIVRYAVIEGRQERPTTLPLPIAIRNDTLYQIRMEVRGDTFTTYLQGQVVDSFSDGRLGIGGIGLFSPNGDRALVRWIAIQHQYDLLGRFCAVIAPPTVRAEGRSGH